MKHTSPLIIGSHHYSFKKKFRLSNMIVKGPNDFALPFCLSGDGSPTHTLHSSYLDPAMFSGMMPLILSFFRELTPQFKCQLHTFFPKAPLSHTQPQNGWSSPALYSHSTSCSPPSYSTETLSCTRWAL